MDEIVSVEMGMELVDQKTGTSVKLEMGEKGPLGSAENFCRVLEQDNRITGVFCYNELAHRCWVRGTPPWEPEPVDRPRTDGDESWLRRWLWREYRLKGKEELNDAINISETLNVINPLKEFMRGLKWDGVSRMDTIMPDYLGVERCEYTTAVTRVMLAGGVARVFRPGVKFDYVGILVGKQGAYKSTFLSRLALKDEWFTDSLKAIDGDPKQVAEQLAGRFIVELAELAVMKRAKDQESIKQFITQQKDSYRAPYSRHPQDRPRSCIFWGSTNSMSFLVDKTGGRRFLPILVAVNEPTKSVFGEEWRNDFEQLWAEAVHYYRNGEYSLILPKEMEREAEIRRGDYQEDDPRVGIIQEYLDTTEEKHVCVSMLYANALEEFGKPNLRVSNELHEIMRNKITGWKLHPNKNGKARCGKYGVQICYVRDGTSKYSLPGLEVELL